MRLIGKAVTILFAVIGLIAVLIAGAGWGILHTLGSFGGAEAVYKESDRFVLALDLDAPMPERDDEPWRAAFGTPTTTLQRAITAIDSAAADPRVVGLQATLSDSPLSMAEVQELRDAIGRFHASGKPTQVFSPTIGEAGGGTHSYYLATAFDDIWLQPSGDLGLSGFGIEVPFVHNALRELGISTELVRRWEYKNAMDSAARDSMSEPHRISLLRLLESWRDQVVDGVAKHTGLDKEKVGNLLDGAPLSARDALSHKLIDHIGYADQADDAIQTQTSAEERMSLDEYLGVVDARQKEQQAARAKMPHIALIQVTGLIARGEVMPGDGQNSDDVAQAIHDAANDPDVRAIVLRISSPGGSYVASDTIWRELMLAREAEIPVIVSMGDMAASGGYFVTLPASKVVAQPATITGSIGVYAFKPVLQEMWSKLNVTWETVALGDYATMWSPHHGFSDVQRSQFEKGVDTAYRDFTEKVGASRHLSPEMVDKIARGRIWTGSDALNVGLVDTLGGQYEAIRLAKQEIGLDPDAPINLRPFPEEQDGLTALLDSLNLKQLASAAATFSRLSASLQPLNEVMGHARVASQGPALLGPPLSHKAP